MTWNKALETGGFLVGDEVKISIELEAIREAEPKTLAVAEAESTPSEA